MQCMVSGYWSLVAKVLSKLQCSCMTPQQSHICRHFPEVLRALFALITMETDPRCLDNICAAVCRMIMVQPDVVPLDQVTF